MDKSFDIRYTELSDDKHLLQWLEDPETLQWFPMSTEKEIADAVKNWVGFSKFRCSLTGIIEDLPCAIATLFLMPYKKVSHHCMIYLVVGKKWQKQGIGTSMLKNLLHLAKNHFRMDGVHAEIYEGCPVERLLVNGFQFNQYARQENFIKINGSYRARLLYELFF